LLEGETSAHRSGPLCHRGCHLPPVGNPPLCPVAHQ
jgi:hypothetical protein